GPVLTRHALPVTSGRQTVAIPLTPREGRLDLFLRFRNPSIPADRTVCLVEWMAFRKALPGQGQPEQADWQQKLVELVNRRTPSVPVLIENPPEMSRKTYVFERGNWLVKGDE